MLARQIEELNIHTDPTLSRAKVNSITHDCPALTLYAATPSPSFSSSILLLLRSRLSTPFSAPSALSTSYPPPRNSRFPLSSLGRPSPGAVRPILRLLVRKYGSTWWNLARHRRDSMTERKPLSFSFE